MIFPFKITNQTQISNSKVVGLAYSVGLLPVALGPSFLDKGVRTGPIATQFGPACVQTMPCLPGTYLRQAELFQISCGR